MKLKGKKAIITGGGRGIGKIVAESFLSEGAAVMLCARSVGELEATQSELYSRSPTGSKIEICPADVSSEKDVDALVKKTQAKLGGIDILVNAAGVYGAIGAVASVDFTKWKETFDTNLFGTFNTIQKVLPIFIANQCGTILNFSGGGDGPFPRFSAYSTSKVAIIRFTETLAQELIEHGITANVIAPGPVNTRILEDALAAGEAIVGRDAYIKLIEQKEKGGVSPMLAAELCVFLASAAGNRLSGKFLSAVWDKWREWDSDKINEIMGSNRLVLRRVA
jgi:3-oxoacyl-[acyl-carrier protein] reductase